MASALHPWKFERPPGWQLTPGLQIPMAQTLRFTSDGCKRDSNGRRAGKVSFALALKQRAASCAVCFNYSFPYRTAWAGAAAPPSVRGASRDGFSSPPAAGSSAPTCAWGALCMGSGRGGGGSGTVWGSQHCASRPLRGHSVVGALSFGCAHCVARSGVEAFRFPSQRVASLLMCLLEFPGTRCFLLTPAIHLC